MISVTLEERGPVGFAIIEVNVEGRASGPVHHVALVFDVEASDGEWESVAFNLATGPWGGSLDADGTGNGLANNFSAPIPGLALRVSYLESLSPLNGGDWGTWEFKLRA